MTDRLHNLIRLLERRADERTSHEQQDSLDAMIARRGRDLSDDEREGLRDWKREQRGPGQ